MEWWYKFQNMAGPDMNPFIQLCPGGVVVIHCFIRNNRKRVAVEILDHLHLKGDGILKKLPVWIT